MTPPAPHSGRVCEASRKLGDFISAAKGHRNASETADHADRQPLRTRFLTTRCLGANRKAKQR